MATEKALLRFRCYNCNKLLGAPASRAGRTTTCPNCKAELIVPGPEEPEESALAEATRSLVPNLGAAPTAPERDRAADEARPRHDPTFSWEEIDTAIFQTPGGPAPIDLPISFGPPGPPAVAEPEPEPEPVPPPSEPEPSPVVVPTPSVPAAAPAQEGIPEITVEAAPIRGDRPRVRRGEVVLSQSVVASWAVFMLLALAISFVAGLFVGHFVWTSR